MDVVTPPAFDVGGPLPTGVTVLEASAGTGKTYTIAALTARYVAAGRPLDEMLLVTFGRAATSELRDRVRARLVSAADGLGTVLAGVPAPADDDVVALLADGGPDEVALRQDRLRAAIAGFDAATIETTHGFCRRVLHGLGVVGDVEDDVTFVEDVSDLVDDVVDDLYLRKFAHRTPDFTLADARRIGREVVNRPDTVIVPIDHAAASVPGLRQRLAVAVRAEVDRRKRRQRVLTYDDLLTRLAATLRDPDRGPAACARLRERYAVVMVDEFQDTDPTQWEIVQRAFGDGTTTLVLIGDPKQAIYAFRGADVNAYLDAARGAPEATLDRNWRSDGDLLVAYDALFAGAELGDPQITYRTVQPVDGHVAPRLLGAPHPAALRVRVVHRDDGRVALTPKQQLPARPSAAQEIADDVAGDIVELLASGAELTDRSPTGVEIDRRVVGPADIAVLATTHRDAALVHDSLAAAGVPAVIGGDGSVFTTPAATEWLRLLQAIERPSHLARVRVAALTCFLGWSATAIATSSDDEWEAVYIRLHEWADVLRRRGVAALFELVTRSERLTARVLSRVGGERRLTDLRHVGQLLHHQATTERLGVAALTAWLQRRIADAAEELHDEDRARRLDSDAAAVQILTIHRSKGLEFPIVYCPFLWSPWHIPDDAIPVFHDATNGGRRTVDVGGPAENAGFAAHHQQYGREVRGESLRLAYVGLTRARHQTVVHWASAWGSEQSALGTLLFGTDLAAAPADHVVVTRLDELAAGAAGTIAVERVTGRRAERWSGPPAPVTALTARPFGRSLDETWRRTSYSGITAAAKEPGVASEPEDAGTVDEDIAVTPGPDGSDAERELLSGVALPLAAIAGGASVGTLLHGVLEHTDFTATDLATELRDALEREPGWDPATVGPRDALVDGLAMAIETPLGPLARGRRLRDVGRADRLDELTFELPLAGGDAPSAAGAGGVRALADVLERHLTPDDPLAGYPAHLRDPLLDQPLRGYLNGSIDAVLRLPGDAGPTYAVVDYKSNWLAPEGADVSAWHYRPAALAVAMQHAHYPLQALLYVVALHRFLRWRIADYDPDVHLAGVLYLFLRGMVGPDTPVLDGKPCGVFSWRPSGALVVATSDLLDGNVRG